MDESIFNKTDNTRQTTGSRFTEQDDKMHVSPLGSSTRCVIQLDMEGISDRNETIGEARAGIHGMPTQSGPNQKNQNGLIVDSVSKRLEQINPSALKGVPEQRSFARWKKPTISSFDRREIFVKAELPDYSRPPPELPCGPGYPPIHNFAPSAYADCKPRLGNADADGREERKLVATRCPQCKRKTRPWVREVTMQFDGHSVCGMSTLQSGARPLYHKHEGQAINIPSSSAKSINIYLAWARTITHSSA